MNQKPLAGHQPAAHDDVRPDGEAGFGQTGRLAQRQSGGYGQRMVCLGQRISGIAATGQQRAHRIADLPACHPGPDGGDMPGTFQSRQGRGIGRWRIAASALQRIGAVYPGPGHADQDLPMARHRHRNGAALQHLWPARLCDFNCLHRVGQRHGVPFRFGLLAGLSGRAFWPGLLAGLSGLVFRSGQPRPCPGRSSWLWGFRKLPTLSKTPENGPLRKALTTGLSRSPALSFSTCITFSIRRSRKAQVAA